MFSSKLLSLLTFAVAAVAQGFPDGEFLISHTSSKGVLEVENESLDPEAFIVLSDRGVNDAQIWSFSNDTRYLTNKASKLVLEVPGSNGEIQYGTRLEQAEPKNGTNDEVIQQWDYDQFQHLFTLASDTACLSANQSGVYAIVDFCDQGDSTHQTWKFLEVE